MTPVVRFVAVAVLVALAVGAPVQAQTPAIDARRVRAEAGDAYAQYDLAVRYEDGRGVPQDEAEATRWYRLAADQGHANSQYNLGFMYATGRGIPQDEAEAVRWYRLAADQGFAEAQFILGYRYDNGEGVPQDGVQAHMWYNLAASRMTGEIRESAVRLRNVIADELTPDDLSEAQRLARAWDAAHPREP